MSSVSIASTPSGHDANVRMLRMPSGSAPLGYSDGWVTDGMHSSSGLHQHFNHCGIQFHTNRTSRIECQVWGRITGVLVSVHPWYLKRGFLGFCFFNEDETHLVNLFSSIKSHLEGLLVQTSASGKDVTVSFHPVDRNKWLTTKPVPYIYDSCHLFY